MIGKLKGIVDSIFNDYIILDVSGVGYMIYCNAKLLSNILIGETYSLFIDTHVREDHIHLFGFLNLEEKSGGHDLDGGCYTAMQFELNRKS